MNFDDNTLLIIPNNLKKQVLNNNKLINIKLTSFNEIRDNLYFKYDEKTIYYLIKKYNMKYEVAKVYLDNLYFIEDKNYNIKRLDKLVSIKQELIDNDLLIFNKLYKNYIKSKTITLYGFNILNKYQKNIIKALEKITKVNIINKENEINELKECYQFNHIEEEITFVLEQISKLINNNISIDKIKLLNVTSEYIEPLKRLSKFYNIKINLNDTTLYQTYTSNKFLKNLKETNLRKALESINTSDLYDEFLKLSNKYIWCENPLELITYDLKQIKVKTNIKGIEINNIEDTNDYYFLLGFNSSYPKTIKDEDYLNDDLKQMLNIDTSYELNKINKENTIKQLESLSNLIITYKNKTDFMEYYPSTLIKELNMNVITEDILYSKYSNIKNKIDLTKSLDLYMKYNHINNNLNILSYNYQIPYLKYNNSFKGISKNIIKELKLSYSSIDNYYKCGFRFYLNNILKLNLDDDTFMLDIGNLFHYMLSICFNSNFNLKEESNQYLENLNKEYSSKEKFFIEKLLKDLDFIITTIKEQTKYISLDESMYEQKIYLDKSNDIKITFSGIVDKVLYKEQNGIKYAIVIDYKTGNPSTSLSMIKDGINLQLPIYLYLLEEKYKDINVVGLYYQKLLQSIPNRKDDYYKSKTNDLKLIGYTIDDEDIINLIDNSYEDSNLIKGMKKGNNGFYHYTKLLNKDKLKEIKEIAKNKIDESINNILDCNFKINPKKYNKETTCKNCIYESICYKEEKDYIYLEGEEDEVDN